MNRNNENGISSTPSPGRENSLGFDDVFLNNALATDEVVPIVQETGNKEKYDKLKKKLDDEIKHVEANKYFTLDFDGNSLNSMMLKYAENITGEGVDADEIFKFYMELTEAFVNSGPTCSSAYFAMFCQCSMAEPGYYMRTKNALYLAVYLPASSTGYSSDCIYFFRYTGRKEYKLVDNDYRNPDYGEFQTFFSTLENIYAPPICSQRVFNMIFGNSLVEQPQNHPASQLVDNRLDDLPLPTNPDFAVSGNVHPQSSERGGMTSLERAGSKTTDAGLKQDNTGDDLKEILISFKNKMKSSINIEDASKNDSEIENVKRYGDVQYKFQMTAEMPRSLGYNKGFYNRALTSYYLSFGNDLDDYSKWTSEPVYVPLKKGVESIKRLGEEKSTKVDLVDLLSYDGKSTFNRKTVFGSIGEESEHMRLITGRYQISNFKKANTISSRMNNTYRVIDYMRFANSDVRILMQDIDIAWYEMVSNRSLKKPLDPEERNLIIAARDKVIYRLLYTTRRERSSANVNFHLENDEDSVMGLPHYGTKVTKNNFLSIMLLTNPPLLIKMPAKGHTGGKKCYKKIGTLSYVTESGNETHVCRNYGMVFFRTSTIIGPTRRDVTFGVETDQDEIHMEYKFVNEIIFASSSVRMKAVIIPYVVSSNGGNCYAYEISCMFYDESCQCTQVITGENFFIMEEDLITTLRILMGNESRDKYPADVIPAAISRTGTEVPLLFN